MVKIVAVSNQKGGVAKTTTTGAVAAGLKKKGFRVLAIDLDPQGNLSNSVGADIYNSYTIYNLMKREVKPEDVIQKLNAFDIIPANITLSGAEQELAQTGKEHRLKEMVSPIIENYDYIFIDTPPSLGILTVNAFTFADEILIPTTAGIFAATGIEQLKMVIDNVSKYCNNNLKIGGILITKYNPRANISKELKELTDKLADFISAPIYNTYIRFSVVIEEAQARKEDIHSYANKSTVSEDYKAFIDEFLKGEIKNGR